MDLGKDRGVAGRPALLSYKREHPVGVQGGRVGRGEVPRDQHERVARVGHAGHGHVKQPGDHPVPMSSRSATRAAMYSPAPPRSLRWIPKAS